MIALSLLLNDMFMDEVQRVNHCTETWGEMEDDVFSQLFSKLKRIPTQQDFEAYWKERLDG